MSDKIFNEFWWEQKKDELYKDLFGLYKSIEQNQSSSIRNLLDNYRLYGNMDSVGFEYYNYNRTTRSMANSLKINVIQSMCDTVSNKIAKNNPKIKFLTSGGDESQQTKAKKLTKFIEGQFYENKVYDKGQFCTLDGIIGGTGIFKTWREKAKICTERVLPVEILVDDNESLYGKPQNMYQKKWVPRDVLISMFPDKVNEIMSAKTQADADYSNFKPANGTKTPDMVMVIEAWHLPFKEDKSDGRHVWAIDTCTLVEEPWKRDTFPFSFIKWNRRPVGFWGKGLAEDLRGIQIEINKTVRTIQLSNELVGVPRVFINAATKIVDAHINDNVGNIIRHEGPMPNFVNAQPIHPDILGWFRELYAKAYEISGISQLSAQSKKPAGLDSGKALREFNDIESERFQLFGQAYEQFYMDIAEQMITLAKEIDEDDTLTKEEKDVKVKVKEKKYLKEISWKEINLKDESYVMQMKPVSSLSGTFSDRIQEVNELINLGIVQKEDAAELLNFPDIEAFMSLETAGVEDIKKTIELILEEEKYSAPEPFQNLAYGIRAFQEAYLRVRLTASQARLQLMRNWISTAQGILKKLQAEQAMTQQMAATPDKTTQSANSNVQSFVS